MSLNHGINIFKNKEEAGRELVEDEIHGMRSSVLIPVDSVVLEGELNIPQGAKGIVLFVYGIGGSKFYPQNTFVARMVSSGGLGTLLFDLQTREEEMEYKNPFNIRLLARRLSAVTQWVKIQEKTRDLQIGYFGTDTGTAATFITASELGKEVQAIVSLGGRPDYAWEVIRRVHVPTLFIVGGNDYFTLKVNRDAVHRMVHRMKANTQLKVIPGADHFFKQTTVLREAARLTTNWFKKHLLDFDCRNERGNELCL